MRSRLSWKIGILLATVVASRAPLRAAEAPSSDPVIVLPPLEVSAALQTTPWRYAELPGAEILSSCSESTTKAFITAEYRIEQLFGLLVPEEFRVKLSVPKIIVLSEQKRTLNASQDLVVTNNPGRDGKGKEKQGRASVRFMPNLRLSDPDFVAVFAVIDEGQFNADQLGLTTEHVRFILEHRTPPLPAWLVDGLTVLATKMTFSRETIEFGGADWMSPAETDPLRSDATFPRTLLAMADLLEQPRPTDAGQIDAIRRWRAQAALFVRWAIDDDTRRQSLWKFVQQVSTKPATEAIFQDCFGISYADARDVLSDLLPLALRNPVRFHPASVPDAPNYRLRLATESEIGRLKGDWERLEISYVRARSPQYLGRYEEQAARTLTKAHSIDERDPRLLAVLGLHACDTGHDDKARPLLEAAAAAKVVRPRVYFELARLRYVQALDKPAGQDGNFNAAQLNAIMEPLRVAHEQLPPLAQTYTLAAEVWARTRMQLGSAQYALLDEGLKLFPNQLNLLYQVATLQLVQGRTNEAAALIERGLQLSPTPAARAGFEKLAAILKAGG